MSLKEKLQNPTPHVLNSPGNAGRRFKGLISGSQCSVQADSFSREAGQDDLQQSLPI